MAHSCAASTGNTTKTIKCGNSSAPTAHTHPHTPCGGRREVCGEGAQVTGQSCCFFSPPPLLLDWPKTASTLYAPFSVRLATQAVRGGAEPHSNPRLPAALCEVWVAEGEGVGRASGCGWHVLAGVVAPSGPEKEMFRIKCYRQDLRPDFCASHATLRTHPPTTSHNPCLLRFAAVPPSPCSSPLRSSNLFYDNIRAFSAEI